MRLSQAVSEARKIEVPFVGATLNVEYRPLSYTPRQLAAMQDEAASSEDAQAAVAMMVGHMQKLLVAWDLTDLYDEQIGLED